MSEEKDIPIPDCEYECGYNEIKMVNANVTT